MSGADMVVKGLEDLDVDVVFGLPGGMVIPLYDKLISANFCHVLVRHEQAAAHAADAYARASGKVGVCIATSGPGATNLVTGIATAYLDSVPILAIAGQVSTAVAGTDAFQEADTLGITLPVVKHSFQVRSAAELGPALRGSFHIAATGRPGPVVIDLPVDVQREVGIYNLPDQVRFPGYNPESALDLSDLDASVEAILKARHPLILAGGGLVGGGAEEALRTLAETFSIPVVNTLMGKGAFSDDHPLALGMAGMHGTPAANRALCETDLVIALGSRFSDRTTGRRDRFAPDARVIHLDRDRAERNKNVTSDLFLLGDAAPLLYRIIEACGGPGASVPAHRKPWLERVARWREEFPGPDHADGEKITPRRAIEAAREAAFAACGDMATVTTEVGQNQMWSALYWRAVQPRTFITSGGLGTMGFGLPAAMGAAFARSGQPVFNISGDGSFLMNAAELDTCARYNLPVKVVLLDNSCLGMVRQWQELFYNRRYSHTLYSRQPDFCGLAESLGAAAIRVTKASELRPAMDRAVETPGPVLIHVPIDTEEKVFPMVPPGAGIDEMILEAPN
jgi:acetolactate synthase-1/2/3 large subunit